MSDLRIGQLERELAAALEENARLKEELTLTRMWIDAAVASCAKRGCTKKEYEATKEQRDRAESAEAELAKLRQHAEAMAEGIESSHLEIEQEALAAYRADFPEETK